MGLTAKIVVISAFAVSATALGDEVFTSVDLKKHNTEADCWMAIEGAVYDMSQYIKVHKEECKKLKFSELCGTDATTVWKGKESGKSPHKKKSHLGLAKAKVGTLSEK